MNIAAELSATKLTVFIEGSNWKKTTQPFNKEMVKVGLIVYIIERERIFHDAVSREEATTHPSLIFCHEEITLTDLKKKLKKAGYSEPYEVRLSNNRLSLRQNWRDSYTLIFYNYCNNEAFNSWLASLPTLEAGFLLQRIKDTGRYFSREFSEFREFASIEDFVSHRADIWQAETVKQFEEAVAKGKVHCPGCDI